MPATTTVDRVPKHTAPHVNERIRMKTSARVGAVAAAGPEAIDRRLRELDEEWDIERAIEANAATAALLGFILGLTVDKRWLVLPAAVATFLLQHAVQGWCPPVPVLRRLGFRTAREIEIERNALKTLRGDFHASDQTGQLALRAAAL